jgi:hypothetical protein
VTTQATLESFDKTLTHGKFHHPRESDEQFYTELIRIVAGLFVGLLALMTFLLTVGYSRPHANFSWALYSSIITLALNLITYVVGHFFRIQRDTAIE